jgi:Na+/melibiose symporter-like transporter
MLGTCGLLLTSCSSLNACAGTTGLRGKKDKRFIMVSNVSILLYFIVALIISTIIIYYIAKLFGAKDSLTTAVLAALIGTAVYTLFYYVLGQGLIAAFIAGIVWLLALQKLYTIGWVRALVIAVVIWIVTSVVGLFLPVL